MMVGACLALINLRRWREWFLFFLVASIIAIPQLLWSTHGTAVSTRAFLAWQFGWDRSDENFFWFWFKNTGLFIPLLITALLWKSEDYLVPRKLLFFYLPFTLCFIIPNLVKLAPWIWDNVKILFYWWLASAPIVALAARASLGRQGLASRPGRQLVHHADAGRRAGCLCFDDATGRVSGIRSRRHQLCRDDQAADAAARDHPARADSQHAGVLNGPAIVDGLSRPHLDARARLWSAGDRNQAHLRRRCRTPRACWPSTASIML